MKRTEYHLPFYYGHYYHVFNKGVNGSPIFFNKDNYYYFLEKFKHYLSEFIDTYAFCLLSNHFHLLIRVKHKEPEAVGKAFRQFFISYSMSVNKQQNRKGNLFQREFKRKIICNEKYLYRVVYYIHSNPTHHNLIHDFRNYYFSSFNIIASNKSTLLRREEVLYWFGGHENFLEFHNALHKFDSDDFVIED